MIQGDIMEFLNRKNIRLKEYDYSRNGAYFITICTQNKKCILSKINPPANNLKTFVGATIGRPNEITHLSKYGKIINTAILNIPYCYPMIKIINYIIMPNHIHLLLFINNECGRAMHAPTISSVIQQFKGSISKQIGFPIFQRSFHDHIIRNEKDYQNIYSYINSNPFNWANDCFYTKI